MLSNSNAGAQRIGLISRTVKIIRALRLIRLLKLRKISARIYEIVDSEYAFIVIGLCKLLVMILCLNHVIACVWYYLGLTTRRLNFKKNWLEDVGLTPVYNTDLAFKYFTSLHWSITQFTPASMDIYATNLVERIFSVCVLFWALLTLSSIIGNITASMTALRIMGHDEMKQTWLLRRHLKGLQLSPQLIERVMKYAEWQQISSKHKVQESQVELMKKISPGLKMEISAESGSPILAHHPLFCHLFNHVGLQTMPYHICDKALTFLSYAEGDVSFETESEALAMYLIHSGQFDYQILTGAIQLHRPGWLAEAALWTMWQHRGTLKARRPGKLCSVDAGRFADALRLHPRTFHLGREYGTRFVEFMNNNQTTLTDCIFNSDSTTDVIFSDVGVCDSYDPAEYNVEYTNTGTIQRGIDLTSPPTTQL
jgi:hypothetical protein